MSVPYHWVTHLQFQAPFGHNGMICPKPSSSSGRVLQFTPADTLCRNDESSQTLVNRIVSVSDSKSWMFSSKLLPDTSFGGDTKSVSSCDFTLVNTPLVTDSFCFLVRTVHTNSQLLRKTELIHRVNDSEQEFCVRSIRIEVCGVSCHSSSGIPRLKAPILLNTGWPASLNRSTIWVAVESHSPLEGFEDPPYHFFSSPGPRNVQCPCENLFAYSLTSSEFEIQIPSFPFIVQTMSLNTDMKMIRSVIFSGSVFRFRKSFWISWRICNDENPWKIFHSDSIASPPIPSNSLWKETLKILPLHLPILWLQLCFDSSFPSIERHVLVLWPTGWLDCEGDALSIVFTFRISSECSNINFWVMLNRLWSSSRFVFLWTSKFAK